MRRTFGSILASLSLALAPTLLRADEGQAEREHGEEISGPMEDAREAAQVVQQMRAQTERAELIDRAQGLFVIPDYATGALIAGISGGEGVLFAREDGEWSNPVFYDIGGLSVGAQAGIAAGSIVMVLMSDRALDSFEGDTTFSLDAEAGLSIVDWSAYVQGEIGRGGDVVVWSDTEGLMGEVSVGVTGVSVDQEENRAYYGEPVTVAQILAGEAEPRAGAEVKSLLTARLQTQDRD